MLCLIYRVQLHSVNTIMVIYVCLILLEFQAETVRKEPVAIVSLRQVMQLIIQETPRQELMYTVLQMIAHLMMTATARQTALISADVLLTAAATKLNAIVLQPDRNLHCK